MADSEPPSPSNNTLQSDEQESEAENDSAGIFEMINRISNRRLLFDSQLKQHSDRVRLSNAWNEVALNLKVGTNKVDGNWCKHKWKKLTDYYRRLKADGIKRSGAGAGKKITWPYYSAIHSIMRSCINENENTISNLDDPKPMTQSMATEGREEMVSHPGENDDSVDRNEVGQGQGQDETFETPVFTATPTGSGSDRKRKRKSEQEASSTEQIIQFLRESGKDEDEEFHFGMTVADRLRKLSPRSNRKAQVKIQSLLYKIEFPEEDSD